MAEDYRTSLQVQRASSSQRLKADGVYVGEVMVAGTVKGSAWDKGSANLESGAIASKFWELFEARGEGRARVA